MVETRCSPKDTIHSYWILNQLISEIETTKIVKNTWSQKIGWNSIGSSRLLAGAVNFNIDKPVPLRSTKGRVLWRMGKQQEIMHSCRQALLLQGPESSVHKMSSIEWENKVPHCIKSPLRVAEIEQEIKVLSFRLHASRGLSDPGRNKMWSNLELGMAKKKSAVHMYDRLSDQHRKEVLNINKAIGRPAGSLIIEWGR